jgi:O-antigen ligase
VWRQATEAFERRWEQTKEGTQSDQLRLDILAACVQLGLENPVNGVSPQRLSTEIGRHLYSKYRDEAIDPHNVFAHLIGGTGIPCTLALLATAVALWLWRPKIRRGMQLGASFFDARNLLRMTMLLWVVRGLFTREILYNPGFCIAIGLAIGLCIVEGEASLELVGDNSGSGGRTIRPMLQRV